MTATGGGIGMAEAIISFALGGALGTAVIDAWRADDPVDRAWRMSLAMLLLAAIILNSLGRGA